MKNMKRKRMPEKDYRASRGARVLGNPTAYQIMKTLSLTKPLTPTELAKKFCALQNLSQRKNVLDKRPSNHCGHARTGKIHGKDEIQKILILNHLIN